MLTTLIFAAALAANVNEQDAKGNTALLRAAAGGSAEQLEKLLEGGAGANLANALKMTPLHVAAADARKVGALLKAKADPNAVSQQGRTPLLVAASVAGALESVQLLAAAGADLKAVDRNGVTALSMAAGANDEAMVRYFIDQGLDVNAADKGGFTPLLQAASHHNLTLVKLMLAKGASPNVANTFGGVVPKGPIALKGLTPLMLAAPYGSANLMAALLDAGADVNARDSRGMTPLMFAVASETQDAAVVKLLLQRGAKTGIRSEAGETAADWARKFNHPAVLKLLGAEPASPKAMVVAASMEKPLRTPRQAVELSLPLLDRTSGQAFREGGCMSCHHSLMNALVVKEARRNGVAVNEAGAKGFREGIVLGWQGFAPGLLQQMDPPGATDTVTYTMLAMAAADVTPNSTTEAMAIYLARSQRPGGYWDVPGISRAPMEEGGIHRAALAVYVLDRYLPEGLAAEKAERLGRARKYLEQTPVRTTDDAVMRLAGLRWAGARLAEIDQARRELLKLQRADGGWSPTRHLPSDAFSTGSALYVLRETGTASGAPVYANGVRYLLRTQQADGSWHVASRAPKFQPYFESGFPHGQDQWISSAGTAWATIALSGALPGTLAGTQPGAMPRTMTATRQ